MRFITGFIIGAILFSVATVFALRLEEPVKFTDLSNPNELASLNFIMEKIQDIVNGRFNFDVRTSVPSTGEEGQTFMYNSGGTRRRYDYNDGAWRYINYDG